MKRAIVCACLTGLLVAVPVAGCGSSSGNSSTTTQTESSETEEEVVEVEADTKETETEVKETETKEIEADAKETEAETTKASDQLIPTPEPSTGRMNLSVGDVATYDDGLAIAVTGVQYGLVNYDDSIITAVAVTIKNTGSESQSFNEYDWEGEDANGVRRNTAYYSKATNELGSGSLAPGGSVSGLLFFDDGVVRVVYTDNVWIDDSTSAWNL